LTSNGRLRITVYPWTCLQRVTVWILWLLLFHGISREYCKDLSYDRCHNMKWLKIQEASFVWVLIEKLAVSELVRKLTFFSWSIKLITVLLCYHKPTRCSYRNLFCNIRYTVIRFAVILFFHLRLFHPSDCFPFVSTCTLLNAILNSLIAVTCSPNHHLCSCQSDDILWTDNIIELA